MAVEKDGTEEKNPPNIYQIEALLWFEKIYNELRLISKTLEKIESDIPDSSGV